jgi:hypothetical protein
MIMKINKFNESQNNVVDMNIKKDTRFKYVAQEWVTHREINARKKIYRELLSEGDVIQEVKEKLEDFLSKKHQPHWETLFYSSDVKVLEMALRRHRILFPSTRFRIKKSFVETETQTCNVACNSPSKNNENLTTRYID